MDRQTGCYPHVLVGGAAGPARYRLWAGMYERETVRSLTILSSDTPNASGRVLLGEIEVTFP